MTRGTNFLRSSKCPCHIMDGFRGPYGHRSYAGHLYPMGSRVRCLKSKRLHYTKSQLEKERDGMKKFFNTVWNKTLKPFSTKVINNPGSAIKIGQAIGMAGASRDPAAIMDAGMHVDRFGAKGKGFSGAGGSTRGRILNLTDGYSGNGLRLNVM